MASRPSGLPKPLEVLHEDHRPPGTRASSCTSLKILQWNIERGYNLPGIIEELRRIDADIICLQEVDIGCDRSRGDDCGREIATALGLDYAFVAEFEEFRSPVRSEETQGGGLHGNAILSKFDLADIRAIVHTYQPIDWDKEGEGRKEPRTGKRVTLAATVRTPVGDVVAYSIHLEVFTGIIGRVTQMNDIFRDCREQLAKGARRLAVLGDLNTMAHSVARLSPLYCCDHLRFASIGQSEARFWANNVLRVRDDVDVADGASCSGDVVVAPGAPNPLLPWWGFPEHVSREAVNPGLADPFHPDRDVTLNNPKYWGLMQGKLDWVLLRGLKVTDKSIGNHDYSLSDHKWLAVDVS